MTGDDNNNNLPTPIEAEFERIVSPFQALVRDQSTAGILLLLCTAIALFVANSSLGDTYASLIETCAGFVFGEWSFEMTTLHWVNSGLMSLFFFVLGLELKREILAGELKDPRQAIPVVAAAIGGMTVPALIYFALNFDAPSVHGWGIPMATDTAFAVAILAMLGKRVPLPLLAFLTALAIIDDLGAIVVIALFYSDSIVVNNLLIAGLLLSLLAIFNLVGVRQPIVYLLGGVLVWVAMLTSGVHATLAGVLVAAVVPARPERSATWFMTRMRQLLDRFETLDKRSNRPILAEEDQHRAIESVRKSAKRATTPLRRWEHAFEHPIGLFVLPVFALTNAGISIEIASLTQILVEPTSLGIILGLVLGKSVGITFSTWLALKLQWGRLPDGVNMKHIFGIGLLGGMGFTMAIFIAGLGFTGEPEALLSAKIAILAASIIAGAAGYLWLRFQS